MNNTHLRESIEFVKEHFNDRYFDGNHKARGAQRNAIEALEKQLPKKPTIYGDGFDDNGEIIYDSYDCPSCNCSYELDNDKYNHCPNCGQKLDWSGENA